MRVRDYDVVLRRHTLMMLMPLGIATGIGLAIGVLGVGLLIGWLLRGRGRGGRTLP